MQIQALEQVLLEARERLSQLKQTVADQARQLEAAHSQLQDRRHDDTRVERVQQQLSHAFQGELHSLQQRCTKAEEDAAALASENRHLRQELQARDEQGSAMAANHQASVRCTMGLMEMIELIQMTQTQNKGI